MEDMLASSSAVVQLREIGVSFAGVAAALRGLVLLSFPDLAVGCVMLAVDLSWTLCLQSCWAKHKVVYICSQTLQLAPTRMPVMRSET